MPNRSLVEKVDALADDDPQELASLADSIELLAYNENDPQARATAAKAFARLAEVDPDAAASLYELPLALLDDLPDTRAYASTGLKRLAQSQPLLYMYRVDDLAKCAEFEQHDAATLVGPLSALAALVREMPAEIAAHRDVFLTPLRNYAPETLASEDEARVRQACFTGLVRLAQLEPETMAPAYKTVAPYAHSRCDSLHDRPAALLTLAHMSAAKLAPARLVARHGVGLFKRKYDADTTRQAAVSGGIAFHYRPSVFTEAYDNKLTALLQSSNDNLRDEAIRAYSLIAESDPSVLTHPQPVVDALRETTIEIDRFDDQEGALSVLIDSIERVHDL